MFQLVCCASASEEKALESGWFSSDCWLIKRVAEGVDLSTGHQVQPRANEALRGGQLQLGALDVPFLLANFGATRDALRQGDVPVGNEFGDRRLVAGPNHAAVVDGKPQQPAELLFERVQVAESVLRPALRLEIVVESLALVRGAAPFEALLGLRLDQPPRVEHVLAVGPLGVHRCGKPATGPNTSFCTSRTKACTAASKSAMAMSLLIRAMTTPLATP